MEKPLERFHAKRCPSHLIRFKLATGGKKEKVRDRIRKEKDGRYDSTSSLKESIALIKLAARAAGSVREGSST
jgi:hypothetical protein